MHLPRFRIARAAGAGSIVGNCFCVGSMWALVIAAAPDVAVDSWLI
jgi:hypothetical protein